MLNQAIETDQAVGGDIYDNDNYNDNNNDNDDYDEWDRPEIHEVKQLKLEKYPSNPGNCESHTLLAHTIATSCTKFDTQKATSQVKDILQ